VTSPTGPVRRWKDEAQLLGELEQLNDLSLEKVREYDTLAVQAAEAEALHKTIRAKAILEAKINGAKSAVDAEARADANERVAEALQHRLVTAAVADACREALRSVRNNQDSLRTAIASHRQMFAGPGFQG
jgi:hypothetical protein